MKSLQQNVLGSFLLIIPVALAAGCGDDSTSTPGPSEDVEMTVTGLPAGAQGDGRFELWISFAQGRQAGGGLRHSTAASAGQFVVGSGGALQAPGGGPAEFRIAPGAENVPLQDDGSVAWQLALDAFVTFEPAVDAEPDDPNLPGVIGGPFLNGTAALGTDHADAIDRDLATAAGSFHLATPTTSDTGDETEGVWFATPGVAAASLVLPSPPAGWTYEGWVVTPGHGTLSLGRFVSPTGADLDGDGPGPGTLAGYAFPGSDFPTGSTGVDLRPADVLVTLEPPAQADGPLSPSFLRVLAASVDAAAAPGVAVPLGNVFPAMSGSVTIPRSGVD